MAGNKRFSKALCDKYDKPVKDELERLMADVHGATFIRNNIGEETKKFNEGFWDQEYKLANNHKVLVEGEAKDQQWWVGTQKRPFKYDTMHIPWRKMKNSSRYFFLFSTKFDYAFLVTRKAIDTHGKKTQKATKYSGWVPEDFIEINVKHGTFYEKKNESWKRV